MIFEAKAALGSFLVSMTWSPLLFLQIKDNHYVASSLLIVLLVLHLCAIILVARSHFAIFWRAYLIGTIFILGLFVIRFSSQIWVAFGLYLCVISFFHISEYLATAFFNPSTLRLESFLLNHSFAYHIAHLVCVIEYTVWCLIAPGIKLYTTVQILGLSLCIFGEIFRKAAMQTAGVNFTHLIQYQKREEHVLVTNGIYSICRHPSYAGWFCWSIGTQILTCNPVCFLGYFYVSWKFFNERIYEEELLLINFFRGDYIQYQSRVPSGVPFVKGYQLKYHSS